jgi:Fe2+ transport system protein B
MPEQQHETSHETKNVLLNKTQQIFIFFSLMTVVLFTTLFSTYPAVHDMFHGIRHALMIIPCH